MIERNILLKAKYGFVEEAECIVCKNKFIKRTKKSRGRGVPSGVRQVNCKTCSPRCSRIHNTRCTTNSKNKYIKHEKL